MLLNRWKKKKQEHTCVQLPRCTTMVDAIGCESGNRAEFYSFICNEGIPSTVPFDKIPLSVSPHLLRSRRDIETCCK